MKQPGRGVIAAFVVAGAGLLVLSALMVVRVPVPSDEMALPDRTNAAIVREFARKVIAEIASLAPPAPPVVEYDIDDVRDGARAVPHVFLASLPSDLTTMRHVPDRKDRFLALMLPHVLKVNEEIKRDRARLLAIAERFKTGEDSLSAEDRVWLSWTAERYGTDDIAKLMRRIDIIPPSLALAQAAEESGWGTSRFAHQGNALFGQRSAGDEIGLIPAERAPEEGIKVRIYDSIGDAVRAYARNLNTHHAYAAFREARAALRDKGLPLSGHALAETLVRYSERGEAYVASLRAIIRLNRLEGFDSARLDRTI